MLGLCVRTWCGCGRGGVLKFKMGLRELSLMNREQAGSRERRVFEFRKEGDRSSSNQGRW
jgi:hypothetical protein